MCLSLCLFQPASHCFFLHTSLHLLSLEEWHLLQALTVLEWDTYQETNNQLLPFWKHPQPLKNTPIVVSKTPSPIRSHFRQTILGDLVIGTSQQIHNNMLDIMDSGIVGQNPVDWVIQVVMTMQGKYDLLILFNGTDLIQLNYDYGNHATLYHANLVKGRKSSASTVGSCLKLFWGGEHLACGTWNSQMGNTDIAQVYCMW